MTLNKRVDKLVRILLCDVAEYFAAKDALIAARRIRNRRRDKSNSVQLRAEQMIGKGWLTKIKSESSGLMFILSEFGNETYQVSVAEFFVHVLTTKLAEIFANIYTFASLPANKLVTWFLHLKLRVKV